MNPRIRRIAPLAALLVAAPLVEARALDVAGNAVSYCLNTGAFTACASATITVAGGTLTAVVRNISNTLGSTTIGRLTAFGFFYLNSAPTPGSAAFASVSGLPPDQVWQDLPAASSFRTSLTNGTFLGAAQARRHWDNSASTLPPGSQGTFSFSLSGGATDWSKVHFAWRGQVLGNNVAFAKCYEGAVGQSSPKPGECIASRIDEPPVTVPEPISMLLLATGLVGIGGANFVRRRRKNS